MKALVIGDSHLKMSIFEEARSFIDQLLSLVSANKYDCVILLGDQFNDFAVVRSEIMSLWTEFFRKASQHSRVIAIVGNHDLAGAEGGTNPMEAFKFYSNVDVIDSLVSIGDIYFMPFKRDNAEFESLCRDIPTGSLLFCHQSFNGAQFENGFYDPHGVEVDCVSHLAGVISGHVHKEQKFANIWYPGTPFQHTFGDAGEPKFIYELEVNSDCYQVLNKISLDMSEYHVVTAANVTELRHQVKSLKPNNKWKVKFVAQGSPSEIGEFWSNPEVRAFISQCKRVSDGLTSTRMSQNLITQKGQTQSERLYEFIKQKNWRTDHERVFNRAKEFLSN